MKLMEDCLTPMLGDFLERRKFDETYGFAENSDTRTFRKGRPQLKLFCRFSGEFFFSSAVYGRGSVADKYVGFNLEDELIAGEILFFSKEKLEV